MALIEIVNDSNTVLIDDNYSNMCVALSSSLTLYVSGLQTVDADYNSISYNAASGEYPQLVLELGSIPMAQVFSSRSGNTWTWRIAFSTSYYGATINYHVMVTPSQVADAGGMLQLRDANSRLIFDSNLPYMTIHGAPITPSQNTNINAGMVDGRKYGVMAMRTGWTRLWQRANPLEPSPPYTFMTQVASLLHRRSGANVISANGIHTQGTGRSDNGSSMNRAQVAALLILDITNF